MTFPLDMLPCCHRPFDLPTSLSELWMPYKVDYIHYAPKWTKGIHFTNISSPILSRRILTASCNAYTGDVLSPRDLCSPRTLYSSCATIGASLSPIDHRVPMTLLNPAAIMPPASHRLLRVVIISRRHLTRGQHC